jgi:hypothetical protein
MMRRLTTPLLLVSLLATPVEAFLGDFGYIATGWILALFGEIFGGGGENNNGP